MPPEPISGGWDAYKSLGLPGLVVFLLLFFIGYLLWTMRQNNKDNLAMTREVIKSLGEATTTQQTNTATMERLESVITESTRQQREHLEYMRTRDEFFGRGNAGGRRS